MSDFKNSALAATANEISDHEGPEAQWRWSFEFRIQPEANLDYSDTDLFRSDEERQGFFKPMVLTNLDFIGDFESAFCDHVNCSVMVAGGVWLKILSPNREQIRVYLTRTRLNYQGGSENMDEPPLVLVFKAVFKDNQEAYETVGETIKLSRLELDLRTLLTLDIDLIDPATEAIQSAPCGGNFRKQTAADVMQVVFDNVCSQSTFEGQAIFAGQVIADRTSKEVREHVTIKAGTPLVDLPLMLQTQMGGIWPTGISRFVQNGIWYFYPPYDTTRVNRERQTLTIVCVPEMFGTGVRRTFYKDADQLKIIAASNTQIKDMTQSNFLLQGDGLRFAKAGRVMDDWLEIRDNKAIAKRSENNSELRIKAPDQTDHRTFNADKSFTDNPYVQYSALAARKGQLLSLVWNYADHTLIRPGMACRVLYESGNEVKELEGVVLKRHAAVQTTQQAASTGDHITTCALFVFCNAPEETSS